MNLSFNFLNTLNDQPITKSSHKKIRLEDELLLYLIKPNLDPDINHKIQKLLNRKIDWEYIIKKANSCRVAPLLYRNLKENFKRAVPNEIMNRLKEYYKNIALGNIYLTGSLLKLINLFKKNSIVAIPYKGPVLAKLVYGDISYKQFADLDILIHKQDITKAKQLLVSSGFKPLPELTKIQEIILLEYMLEHSYMNRDKGISLDIHWRVAPKYFMLSIDYEKLWKNLKPVSILDMDVLTFCPEDLLFILCIHGIRNLWNQLNLISDVAKLIDSYKKMDWDKVLKQSNRKGNKRFLLLGLNLAKNFFDIKLPKEILRLIKKDKVVISITSYISKKLLSEEIYTPNIIEKTLCQVELKEKFFNKLRFIFHLMVMVLTTDCKFLHLPKSVNFLCKLLKPIRFLLQYRLILLKKDNLDK